MKFFKLVEIDEKEYVERTRDLDFYRFCNNVSKASDVYPDDKNIYIAVDDIEDEIRINISDFDDEDEDYEEENFDDEE